MYYRKAHILFCSYLYLNESRFFYCSVVVGHGVLLKATSGPRHKKGWEALV